MDDKADFMTERITKDNGTAFLPSRYTLKSKNDAIIQPYKTYELFYEITFHVIQKLGLYEDIGSPGEIMKKLGELDFCESKNAQSATPAESDPADDVWINIPDEKGGNNVL